MSLTRRRFIEAASLTLLASAARPIAFAQTASGLTDDTFQEKNLAVLDNASEETFKPLVGERFTVMHGKQQLESLTLDSVTTAEEPSSAPKAPRATLSSKPANEATTGFGLHFRGSGKSLSQGTYTMKNHSLGSFALFIVPGGPGLNPHTYTATFNRLAQ
jgi:hypothetical protein